MCARFGSSKDWFFCQRGFWIWEYEKDFISFSHKKSIRGFSFYFKWVTESRFDGLSVDTDVSRKYWDMFKRQISASNTSFSWWNQGGSNHGLHNQDLWRHTCCFSKSPSILDVETWLLDGSFYFLLSHKLIPSKHDSVTSVSDPSFFSRTFNRTSTGHDAWLI